MSEDDMKTKWPDSKDYTDLCGWCLELALNPEDHELTFNPDINLSLDDFDETWETL